MNLTPIPTPRQAAFQDWEFGVFFHFGIRTFYEGHTDWDGLPMPAEAFDPRELDCRQWLSAAREAGARYAILVCKHHDGFANWPSQYSSYSVASTPWRGGQGDVVREFTCACRAEGLKVGLYYSPAQEGFRDWSAGEYDDYFVNQITELLSDYGKIDYLWFDGCGSGNHKYDTVRIVSVIRALQPEILLFNMWDPDTRWCGNESGWVGLDNRSYVRELDIAIDVANPENLENGCYLPVECDCCIRGHTWFYSDANEHMLKTPEELFALYCASVGNNGNFLLNIGPDRRGLLPDADVSNLRALGNLIRRRLTDAAIPCAFDREGDVYTARFAGAEAEEQLVSGVILEEDLTEGERIGAFRVELMPSRYGARMLTVHIGQAVGHKRICLFPPIRTGTVRVTLDAAEPGAELRKITVLRYAADT
ncbi:MAG: alpha-L-fucosidase [Oscillospiraceae bacterium]|nr:alpha-L-fucosidase [Oscillospiraceae bacterium]